MNTFKQFHESMSRRGFLGRLFGGAAVAALGGNPTKLATAVVQQTGQQWIKMNLEVDMSIFDYSLVSPKAIGAMASQEHISTGNTYEPGVSKDGSVIVDFGESGHDSLEVYLKPGTEDYDKVYAHLFDDSATNDFFDNENFMKNCYETLMSSKDSAKWFNDTIETFAADNEEYVLRNMKDSFDAEDIPYDWIPTTSHTQATHHLHDWLRLREEEFPDAEISDDVIKTFSNNFKKAIANSAKEGDEESFNNAMQGLKDVTGDEDMDYPDENEITNWGAGEYDEIEHEPEEEDDNDGYEQPPGTGVDTSWTDKLGNTLSLSQVYDLAEPFNRATSPENFKHLLTPTERDPARVQATDIQEPILIAYDGKTPISIIDGQHRLTKALEMGEKYIPWIRVDVNSDPRLKQLFTSPPEDRFDKLTNQMSDDYDERDEELKENFIDGKKKGKSRPGRVKRSGASCSGSVTSLRKKAKAGGERGKMYHWCANMKSGKNK